MMNSNDGIKEELTNGTPCLGQYIKLKHGCKYRKENWEGYMVNTIYANEIEFIICEKKKSSFIHASKYL